MDRQLKRLGHDLLRPAKFFYVLRYKEGWLGEYAKSLRKWKSTMPPLFRTVQEYREGKKEVYEDAMLSEFERLKRAFDTVFRLAQYA